MKEYALKYNRNGTVLLVMYSFDFETHEHILDIPATALLAKEKGSWWVKSTSLGVQDLYVHPSQQVSAKKLAAYVFQCLKAESKRALQKVSGMQRVRWETTSDLTQQLMQSHLRPNYVPDRKVAPLTLSWTRGTR